jgi:hypothetical protein
MGTAVCIVLMGLILVLLFRKVVQVNAAKLKFYVMTSIDRKDRAIGHSRGKIIFFTSKNFTHPATIFVAIMFLLSYLIR